MIILQGLREEHRAFCAAFARIECILPRVLRRADVRHLARQVETQLCRHARAEEDLVLITLDHLPERQGWCQAFHLQHHEIDARLTQARMVDEVGLAKQLLQEALEYSRRHFAYEESQVLPLFEQWIDKELLAKFGRVWMHRRGGACSFTQLATLCGEAAAH